MTRYRFDVKMFAELIVPAASEKEGRRLIDQCVDGASAKLGAWPNGDPILCTLATDGEHDFLTLEDDK